MRDDRELERAALWLLAAWALCTAIYGVFQLWRGIDYWWFWSHPDRDMTGSPTYSLNGLISSGMAMLGLFWLAADLAGASLITGVYVLVRRHAPVQTWVAFGALCVAGPATALLWSQLRATDDGFVPTPAFFSLQTLGGAVYLVLAAAIVLGGAVLLRSGRATDPVTPSASAPHRTPA